MGVFNAIRGGLKRYATALPGGGALGAGFAKSMSRWNNTALMATGGALAGATYGAFSENTSILGGMAMGAGIAAGGYTAYRTGARAARYMGQGMGAGQALARSARVTGQQSSRFFGNKYTRAVNTIGGLAKDPSLRSAIRETMQNPFGMGKDAATNMYAGMMGFM